MLRHGSAEITESWVKIKQYLKRITITVILLNIRAEHVAEIYLFALLGLPLKGPKNRPINMYF